MTVPQTDASYVANYTNVGVATRVILGLQALYEFNEGSGTTITDSSGVGTALDLSIPDPAAVTWGGGTLSVNQSTSIISINSANKINDAIKASNALTIEAWITPANTTQTGPSRIVSLSTSPSQRNATLGQGDSGAAGFLYSQRLRTTTTGNNGSSPTVTTAPGSLTTTLTHVVYTRDATGEARFYLDGVLVTTTTVGGNLSNWDSAYSLILANEVSGDRPWLGTFDLIAFYDRALSEAEVNQNFIAGADTGSNVGDPIAENDLFATDEDSAITGNLLADNGNGQDTDPDGDPLTVVSVNGNTANVDTTITLTSGAQLTVANDGTFNYDPNGQFESLAQGEQATDSLAYTIDDGNFGTDTATVTITINGINDAPTIAAVADVVIVEGNTQTITVNATDPESDTLTFSLGGTPPGFVSITNPPDNTGTLDITPAIGDEGVYSITVNVTDDGTPNQGDTTSLSLTVIAAASVNPPIAQNDTVITDEDTVLSGNVFGDNGNGLDTDPDGDPITVVAVNGSPLSSPITLPSGAELTIASDGSFSYDPAGQFEALGDSSQAIDSFSYTIDDGNFGTDTATVTVTVTVSGINDAPSIAAIATQTVAEGDTVVVSVSASDVESDTLTLSLDASTPSFITLQDNGDGSGQLTLAPLVGDEGTYTIPVTVTDNGVPVATATTNLTVNVNVPDPRVTLGLQALYEFNEGSGTTITDSSGVGTALDLSIPDPAAVTWGGGTLSVNQNTSIASINSANKINDAIKASNALTIEAWITPANTTQTGPSRIVSLSTSPSQRNATLGQGNSSGAPGTLYSQRLRTTTTGNNGSSPTVTTAPGSLTTTLTHVVYTRDATGEARFYLDGVLVTTTTVGGNLSNWDSAYSLILANEVSGDRPWLGTFDLIAFYDRALSEAEVNQNFIAGAD